jgi:hypothetical protein
MFSEDFDPVKTIRESSDESYLRMILDATEFDIQNVKNLSPLYLTKISKVLRKTPEEYVEEKLKGCEEIKSLCEHRLEALRKGI